MPGLLAREKLERPCRDIFLAKLALIHQAVETARVVKAREEMEAATSSRASGDTMIAAERT